jgi:hypothetical protein
MWHRVMCGVHTLNEYTLLILGLGPSISQSVSVHTLETEIEGAALNMVLNKYQRPTLMFP